MATKPTIYKAKIALSDMDRNYYDTLNLTIARHPSETEERMMVRLLAFCFNACEGLVLCKGLSDADEADLWAHSLDGTLELWIDVGEPAVDRIRKASRIAKAVRVYSFNSKSATWWAQHQKEFSALNVSVFRFDWEAIKQLSSHVARTMDISVTIAGDSAYVATSSGEVELGIENLQN